MSFPHSPDDLKALMTDASTAVLSAKFGGTEKLIQDLQTDGLTGLSDSAVTAHRAFYGVNKVEPRPPKSFICLFFETFKDVTIIILLVAAIISIVVNVIPQLNPEPLGWIDGVAILVAVILVALVSSINNYSKEKQFRKLNAVKNDKKIKVVRNGSDTVISIFDIVVGDIVILELGDQIPADGLLLQANDMKCDESGMTGETDEIKKDPEDHPFVTGSCLVTHGSGRMLVTAVGRYSKYGDILATLQEEDEQTPLQEKLEVLAKYIGYIGMAMAGVTVIALIIRFFVDGKHTKRRNYVEWVKYFITGITIIVVAVPEGLPLAVTISLAFSMKKMMKDQCLVRKLQACETMGGVNNITSDKTGTLTLNQMTVVRMRVAGTQYAKQGTGKEVIQPGTKMLPTKADVDNGTFNKGIAEIFALNASINSTANLSTETNDLEEKVVVVGSKTEGALLLLTRDMGFAYKEYRELLVHNGDARGVIAHAFEFTSDRKRMSVVLDLQKLCGKSEASRLNTALSLVGSKTDYLVFTKGASEIVLGRCSRVLTAEGQQVPLDDAMRKAYDETITEYARQSLRTFCLAYRVVSRTDGDATGEIGTDEETGRPITGSKYKSAEFVEQDLILICLVGIMDPLRPGVADAVERSKRAGITVRMVTGDNLITAVAIAKDCGILPEDLPDDKLPQYVITGPDFRKLEDAEVDRLLPTLQVIARAAPKDKYRLVKRLKLYNNIVAATGDGSNDAPQLKAADVGLAMGIAGTEVAKEASDIIIMDDNFLSIVRAVEWGRTVLSNVRKFLQFQLTVNVAAVVVAFLGAAALEESPLTALQMLYVNLIMDSLGALALATEDPAKDVLDYQPVHRAASLITPCMLRNILVASVYEIVVILLMIFPGVGDTVTMVPQGLFDTAGDTYVEEATRAYRYTCIYNFFIFAQIFNEFNSRRIHSELNVFQGLHKAVMFLVIFLGTTTLQIIIMLVPGIRLLFHIFDCHAGSSNEYCGSYVAYGISWQSWLISLGLALGIFVIHFLFRLIKLPPEFRVSEKAAKKAITKRMAKAGKERPQRKKKSFDEKNAVELSQSQQHSELHSALDNGEGD
ncbi:Plasma membrane calcium-transporting ATPase 2 [Giardia muris]|uniref:Plasma membrane calcium-transporting ATPase 2 n=1 Tax=Giardia muris TaxID=5742 RepID=A0A4Z1SSK6_GIAMU|nr:Plasma membrane calcium-transporting ATPase 2 [Giardia muris]|eukprot:TNJ28912.1 Plasma membrane calcium-transporting ATPase 2 [Giardia muris]